MILRICRAWFPGFLGVDHTLMMHPALVLWGQNSLPQACPFESWNRHPRSSAYRTACSISAFACRGLGTRYPPRLQLSSNWLFFRSYGTKNNEP